MWLNTPASALTETSILYTDGLTHGQTDKWMDRKADSSLPLKTFILSGYNKRNAYKYGNGFVFIKVKERPCSKKQVKTRFFKSNQGQQLINS